MIQRVLLASAAAVALGLLGAPRAEAGGFQLYIGGGNPYGGYNSYYGGGYYGNPYGGYGYQSYYAPRPTVVVPSYRPYDPYCNYPRVQPYYPSYYGHHHHGRHW